MLSPINPLPDATGKSLRIWLIEDNEAYRNSVAKVVRTITGADGLLSFRDCEAALTSPAASTCPDVVLLDIGLPGMSGIEGISRLKEVAPATCIVMLTNVDDHNRVFEAICAGASGYLLKTSPIDEIMGAIRDVVAGGSPMTPKIARAVLEQFARMNVPKPKECGLSPREKEVLEAMARGRTMKEIASDLTMSYHTADTHIRRIYEKLHVHTRSGAVAKAFRDRLV